MLRRSFGMFIIGIGLIGRVLGSFMSYFIRSLFLVSRISLGFLKPYWSMGLR